MGSLAYKNDSEISIISPLYVSFKANNNIVIDGFLLHWFSSENFTKQMIFEGGVRNTLNFENLIQIKINLPPLPEQTKIADCLSSLDELISAESQKCEALKTHKKGLMQNLFPQEGEKVPRLRFPEFKDSGDWEEKKLGEVGETINGLNGKNGEDFGTGKPYVTYKQVFDNSHIKYSECSRVNVTENENQNILQKGDILFTTSSETPNEVGYASILIDSPEEPTYLNSFCFALRPFDLQEIQPEFSRYLFHSSIYRKSISALAQGSTRYNISKNAFLKLKLPFPHLPEQTKIAACLSSLDELITAQANKIEQLKQHKKGLMQGLFPSHCGLDPQSPNPNSHCGLDPQSSNPNSHCGLDPQSHNLNSLVGLDPQSPKAIINP